MHIARREWRLRHGLANEITLAKMKGLLWDSVALFSALQTEQWDTFCYFVDCGANIHIKNILGEPLLHVVVQRRVKQCIEKLLLAGADVDCTNEYKETSLHEYGRYCDVGNADILMLLLNHKANVNFISELNESPLDVMLRHPSTLIYQAPILINAGGKLCSLKKENMHPDAIGYVEKLSACKSASIALRIALRKTRKVNKDVIPLIESMVFQSWWAF